ncbi:hypothetical protein FPD38_05265 [Campylobacter volucris]|uniref:Uncharacterized protein n=1 Tax=Campylobacter volucris TaxID=1031542 RepID=A0A5C7DT09_9BACT|nr:hypothetical protein [Campylobacter volucris]TXE87596.1 hypothetical protein FPD38_05265 [Campylobacter volucris]
MDNWKKLEDLNLFEVQKRTQIEIACLELIIKKDFKSLSRFNINGFIKILQREYELDFTSFLEEYDAYLAENGVEKKNSAHVCPRMSSYTKEKSYFWFFIAIIVVALIILSALAISKLLQDVADENTTNVLNQEQIIIEGNDTNATILFNEKGFIEENSTDDNESIKEILDVNVSVQDENASVNENLIIEENVPKKAKMVVNESTIKPNAELWLGMVDLKTFQKSSKTIKNEYVISLEKDMLITTGHAAFSLNDEYNNILEFKSGVSKFLMIKDGKIKQINKTEFIKENRGKLW